MKTKTSKVGRPSTPEKNHTNVLTIRLDDHEYSNLSSASELMCMSRAKVIRSLLELSLRPIEPLLTHHVDEDSLQYERAAIEFYHLMVRLGHFR